MAARECGQTRSRCGVRQESPDRLRQESRDRQSTAAQPADRSSAQTRSGERQPDAPGSAGPVDTAATGPSLIPVIRRPRLVHGGLVRLSEGPQGRAAAAAATSWAEGNRIESNRMGRNALECIGMEEGETDAARSDLVAVRSLSQPSLLLTASHWFPRHRPLHSASKLCFEFAAARSTLLL